MFSIDHIVRRLERNAETIRVMVESLSEAEAARRPGPGIWSVLEVINHLYDGEREDFRTRIDLTLHHPGTPWPPIDPEGWITSREYGGREFAGSLRNFLDERRRSLEWLRSLDSPDWNMIYLHPARGPLIAGTILVSWAAHDYLHIRQLARILYEGLKEEANSYSVEYAGSW